MSIYTEHAKRFLENCGIRITGKYKGRYVPLWDTEPHSTWEIVLRREDRQKGERQAIFITFFQSHANQHKTPPPPSKTPPPPMTYLLVCVNPIVAHTKISV